jgi:uncharacterized membrane protein
MLKINWNRFLHYAFFISAGLLIASVITILIMEKYLESIIWFALFFGVVNLGVTLMILILKAKEFLK